MMHTSLTLYEQVNYFNKPNHGRLFNERKIRQRLPVYSSLNYADNKPNIELRALSIDVYATKHLLGTKRMGSSYSKNTDMNQIILPIISKDLTRDNNNNNSRRQKRRRPLNRKALVLTYPPNSTEADLALLKTHGRNLKIYRKTPSVKDDRTDISFQTQCAPPPSPSDDEIDRSVYEFRDRNISRATSRQSPIEQEGYVPFRLPALKRSARYTHTPIQSAIKPVKSTLSNYHQKYS